MAKTLLGDLFPASTKLCRDLAPWLYEKIFPPLGPLCERTTFAADLGPLGAVQVFYPTLVPCCLLGCLLGFAWGLRLLAKFKATPKDARTDFAFGCAYVLFGLMNVGALIYHCSTATGALRTFAYVLDTGSTGASSVCIFIAFMSRYRLDDRARGVRRAVMATIVLAYTVGALGLIVKGTTLACEFIYLVPTIMLIFVPILELQRPHPGQWYGLIASWCLGACVLALLSEPYLCQYFGPHFSTPFWGFLACDLGMIILMGMTTSPVVENLPSPSLKKQQ